MKGIFYNDFKNAYIPNILKEIYLDRLYETYVKGRKDLITVDVGANIGLVSQYLSDYSKQVYSYEPAKPHFDILSYMIDYNKLKNITPIKKALSNKVGKATFYYSVNTTCYSLSKIVNDNKESEEVDTITIKQIFTDNKLDYIDLMKLDVEGTEMDILASNEFKLYSNKIKLIIGEFHAWANINPHQIQAVLEDNGYHFEWKQADATIFVANRI